MPGEFNVGDEVQLRTDRAFKGVVKKYLRKNGRDYYKVQHEDGRRVHVASSQLIKAMPGNDLEALIKKNDPGGKTEFIRNYTFRKPRRALSMTCPIHLRLANLLAELRSGGSHSKVSSPAD